MRFAVALAAGAAILMPQAVEAEPQVLTASQMDQVTAGGVYVNATALAGALGDFADALTYTDTEAVSSRWVEFAFGLGVARSFACCGADAEAYAATLGVGAGDNMRTTTHATKHKGGLVVVALSVVTAIAVSRTPPAEIFQSFADGGPFRTGPR